MLAGIIVDPNSDQTANDTWAIVVGTTVVELINASYNFISQYSSQFDYAVDITVGGQNPVNVGYTYNAGSDTFSLSAPNLVAAIQENLNAFASALDAYVQAHYSLSERFNLLSLYVNAQQNSLTSRMAYISQIFTWMTSVTNYAATYEASIKAMTDINTILTTLWDFNQISPDPQITPLGAIAISN